MSIQEIEERSYFPQSEAQNCLAEAMPAARARYGPVRVFGNPNWKFQMDVFEVVHCQATDAVAGTIHTETHWFSSITEANQWFEQNYDPDRDVKFIDHLRIGVIAKIAAAYRDVFSQELPEMWQTPLRTFRKDAISALRSARQQGKSIREAFAAAIAATQTEYLRCESEIPF